MTSDSPESSVFLWDAGYAAEKIGRFIDGRTLNEYLTDEMLRSAVELQSRSSVRPLPACAGRSGDT